MTHSSENIFIYTPGINADEIQLDIRFPQLSEISLISHLFLLDCNLRPKPQIIFWLAIHQELQAKIWTFNMNSRNLKKINHFNPGFLVKYVCGNISAKWYYAVSCMFRNSEMSSDWH